MSKNAVCYTIIVICLFTAAGLAKYSGGTGEPNDPYKIATVADLLTFAADTNDYNKCLILTANIDLDPNLPDNQVFTTAVIARDTNSANLSFDGSSFTGIFDGADYKIHNLTIDTNGIPRDYLGLFGKISNGEIKNLGLENVNIRDIDGNNPYLNNFNYIGGLVGSNYYGNINSCYSTGYIFSGNGTACSGGLIGDNYGYISNCFSTCSITCGRNSSGIGGLVGNNYYGTIIGCHSTGSVFGDGTSCSGGLVGWSIGDINDCFSTSDVSGVNNSGALGGLVGMNKGDISRCFTNGTIIGRGVVGGLTGDNHPGKKISDSYSLCVVSGDEFIGGLTGYNMGIIHQSYAAGKVDGNDFVGAFVGRNRYQPSYWKCFWDAEINPDANSIGDGSDPNVTGLTTAEMQIRKTFADAGWDMVNVWDIGENQTYPFLRTHLPSDINKDDETNFLDLAIQASHWLGEK